MERVKKQFMQMEN